MKPVKIKRTGTSYRSSPLSSPFARGLAVVGAVALMAVVGAALYEPVYRFVMALDEPAPPASSEPAVSISAPAATSSPQSSSLPASTSASVPAQVVSSEAPAPKPVSTVCRARLLGAETLISEAKLEAAIQGLAAQGCTGVALELKTAEGLLPYISASGVSGLRAEGAVELAALVERLHTKGLRVYGYFSVYRDSQTPRMLLGSAVLYRGTAWNWVDDSVQNGGKPWLNPFSEKAQSYNLALITEALDAGCDGVLLAAVQFPSGYSLQLADYGETGDRTRAAALSEFTAAAAALCQKEGAACHVLLPAEALLRPNEMIYGEAPVESAGTGAMLSLSGEMLTLPVQYVGVAYEKPREELPALTAALLSALSPDKKPPLLLSGLSPSAGEIEVLSALAGELLLLDD